MGKGVDDDSLERVLFIDSAGSFEMNESNNNGLTDSGSPSQLMTTSMIGGGSQSNLSLSGRSRSPSLRRTNDQSKSDSNISTSIYNRINISHDHPLQILSSVGFRKIFIVVRIA